MFQPSTFSHYAGDGQLSDELAQKIANLVSGKDTLNTFSFDAPGVNVQLGEQPEPWNPLWYIAGGCAAVGVIGVGLWATGKIKF